MLVQVLQEEDIGHLALILALRLLPELPDLDQDNALADMASELVVHWADLLIETARATRESYAEDRRLTRLRLLARSVRPLKQRIVQAGVARLTSAFLDPGEHEQVRCYIIHCIGDLGEHAPLQALFSCLRACPIRVSMELEHALPMLANQVSSEPLIAAVLDPNEHGQVREQAALLLGKSGKPEGIPALIQVAREDDSCASTAIDALALLGKDAPLDVLLDILRNDNSQQDGDGFMPRGRWVNWARSKRTKP